MCAIFAIRCIFFGYSDVEVTILRDYVLKMSVIIEPTGRRTRRALEKGEKYCPLIKIEVKKKVVKTRNEKI